MFLLVLVLCLSCVQLASSAVLRVGTGGSYGNGQLVAALSTANDNDIVELLDPEYVVISTASDNGASLIITKAITLRSTNTAQRSVIRSDSADAKQIVIGIAASRVTLENIVIGSPVSGASVNVDRMIGVLVAAGTTHSPSILALGTALYNNSTVQTGEESRKRSTASLSNIHVARDQSVLAASGKRTPVKRQAAIESSGANLGLHDITITNVDFTTSKTHANLAFDLGAYVNIRVQRCTFADDKSRDSIVTVAGATFDKSSTSITLNVFGAAPVINNGQGMTFGANYWPFDMRATYLTFCLDRPCTKLGPVFDSELMSAFPSVSAALTAGARRIVITSHEVELALPTDASQCPIVTRADTTIEGDVDEHCQPDLDGNGATVVKINVRAPTARSPDCSLGSLISIEGSLSGMQDLQFIIHKGVSRGLAFVAAARVSKQLVQGASEEELGHESVLNNVAVFGIEGQIGVVQSASTLYLSITNSMFIGTQTGVMALTGSLNVDSTLFLSNSQAGISVAGVGKRGLVVTSSLFVKGQSGIAFDTSVKTSDMITLGVSCSRFVAAPLRVPSDCAANGPTCADMLRYNTLVAVPSSVTVDDRRTLSRGENLYIEATPADVAGYAQVVMSQSGSVRQRKFEMDDHHGRVDDVVATVTVVGTDTNWQMMMATHVPVSQKCFAQTLPSGTDPEGPARVVSNLFEVRTNAPSQCISVSLRIQLDNSTDLHDGEDLTVFSVTRLGTKDATWQSAASHVVQLTPGEHGTVAVDASSGGGELMSAVVVAAHSNALESGAGRAASVAAIGRLAAQRTTTGAGRPVPIATTAHAALTNIKSDRQLCVACGNDAIPAYLIAERCGGNTQKNVLTSLDAALLEAQDYVTSKQQSVSLMVYGGQCVTTKCTYQLGSSTSRLLIEGVGPDARGSVRRPGSCDASAPFLVARTSGVTLRYLLISSQASVQSAIPTCVVQAPASNVSTDSVQLVFSTVSGGVCIGAGRTKTALLGNEISGSSETGVLVSMAGDSAVLERNSFSLGALVFSSGKNSLMGNKIFASSRVIVSNSSASGQVTSAINVYGSREWSKDKRCVDTDRNTDFISDSDTYGDSCSISLGGTALQSVRQTLSRTSFSRVQIDAYANVQLSNITLLTSGAAVFARGLDNTVFLNNVQLDLSATSVGASLIGTSKRPNNKCAVDNEALLAGFVLSKSTVFDLSSKRRLLPDVANRWPADNQFFVSPVDGSLLKCADAINAGLSFCVCANPPSNKTIVVPVATKLALPLDEKRVLQPAKPAQPIKLAITPKVPQVNPLALTPVQQCSAEACPTVSKFSSNSVVGCDFFTIFEVEAAVTKNIPFCTDVNQCFLSTDLSTGQTYSCASASCTQQAVNDVFGCTCDTVQTVASICACSYTEDDNAEILGVAQCTQPPTPAPTTAAPETPAQQCDVQTCPSINGFSTSSAIGCELFTVFEIQVDVPEEFSFCSAVSECTIGFDLITHSPYKCQQSSCTASAVANPAPCVCGTQTTTFETCACTYTDDTDADVFGVASCVQASTAASTTTTTTTTTTTLAGTTTTTTSPGGTTAPNTNTITLPKSKNNNNTIGLVVGLGVAACLLICCCILICLFCTGIFGAAAVADTNDRQAALLAQNGVEAPTSVQANARANHKFNYGLGHHID